jgi:hypothetical protein
VAGNDDEKNAKERLADRDRRTTPLCAKRRKKKRLHSKICFLDRILGEIHSGVILRFKHKSNSSSTLLSSKNVMAMLLGHRPRAPTVGLSPTADSSQGFAVTFFVSSPLVSNSGHNTIEFLQQVSYDREIDDVVHSLSEV